MLAVFLLVAGYELIALALLEIFITCVGLIIDLVLVRRLFGLKFGFPRFDQKIWRRLRAYGAWSFLDDLVTEGAAHLDKVVLPILFPLAMLAPYTLSLHYRTSFVRYRTNHQSPLYAGCRAKGR